MTMNIASLQIENFRGIKKGVINFKPHTILIGANNTGKSTIIEALALVVGRDGLVKELTEHDFWGSNPQPVDRIKLIATISNFEFNTPDRHTDWFREGRAVPKWLDQTTGIVHSNKPNEDCKLCCQIAVQAYFDSELLSVEIIRYFHDDDSPVDPFSGDSVIAIPRKLLQQLGFFLVRANRTWDKALSWGSELFRRTINVTAAQPAAAIIAERDRLRTPINPIENDERIAPLIHNVNKELKRCIVNSPKLQLRITSTDSKSVLDVVSAHFGVAGTDSSIPATRQGSGLISLQGLILLLELGRARIETGEKFILALEEPEVHISPSTQQQLVRRVQSLSTQTLITTHSPAIAALYDPTSVFVLRNKDGILVAEPFLVHPILPSAQAWERRFFQLMRVDVISSLMYSKVLIPEGKADYFIFKTILWPLVLSERSDIDVEHAFSLEIGVVPTEDAKVIKTYEALSRLHGDVGCLVDGDMAGKEYINELLKLPNPPKVILSWGDGLMIEDIVGWILEASKDSVTKEIKEMVDNPELNSIEDTVQYMKDHKVDIVMYESIANIIAYNENCRIRANDLFSAITAAYKNISSENFKKNNNGIWVFHK